jgi:tol-pal system protein YbgF
LRRKGLLVLSVLLSALIFAACGSSKEIRKIEDDIAYLEREIQLMKQKQSQLEGTVNSTKDSLYSEIEKIQRVQADSLLKIDSLNTNLQILSEKLDDSNYRLSSFSQELSNIKLQLKQPQEIYQPPQEKREIPEPVPSSTTTSASPEELYNQARADLLRGNYDLAIAGFKEFLRLYPDHDLADNAQYWLGECHYAQEQFSEAALEFDKVLTNYPRGDKVASAYLKKGFSYFELNQTARGVIVLQQLIKLYPNSNEAKIARERLQGLGLRP